MDSMQTVEGKLLYKVYNLYKMNHINEHIRGRIKDLIVQRDERVEHAMTEYLTDRDEPRFLERLQTCTNEESSPSPFFSDDCFSVQSSKYKFKRPAFVKLPPSNFTINLRKNTDLLLSPQAMATSTSRSTVKLIPTFEERYKERQCKRRHTNTFQEV